MKKIKSIIPGSDWNTVWVVIDGIAYCKSGYFGCQLLSIEKSKPDALKRRVLKGDILHLENFVYSLELFGCTKVGFRKYECTWALPQRESYEDYAIRINQMWGDLLR